MPIEDIREELIDLISHVRSHVKEKGPTLGYWKDREKYIPTPKSKSSPANISTYPPLTRPSATLSHEGRGQGDNEKIYTPADNSGTNKVQTDFVIKPNLSAGENLAGLREHIGDCQICPLGGTRIKLAFGVGNPEAKVMIIGEGPGYMEDRQGEPFVGPAGQLLDKILSAIELSRKQTSPAWKWVYIANMVKCHPMIDPSNSDKKGNDRPPTPEEMTACHPFLLEQIRIIRPAFIVALGATAAKGLLKTSRGITAIHGQWFDYAIDDGSFRARLMPTYHPAALLRNPDLKKDVWEDVKKLRAELLSSVS